MKKFFIVSLVGALLFPQFVLAKNASAQNETLQQKVRLAFQPRNHFFGTIASIQDRSMQVKIGNVGTLTIDISTAKWKRRFGAVMAQGDAQVNDQVEIMAKRVNEQLIAEWVRDLSLQAFRGQFTGTIKSIQDSSFVLQSRARGEQTIEVTTSTKIKKLGHPAAFSDLLVGAEVFVDGVWNRTNKNVTANEVRILVRISVAHLFGIAETISSTSFTLTIPRDGIYNVTIQPQTVITNRQGRRIQASEILKSDILEIRGWSEKGKTDIQAQMIHDMSI